MPMCSRLIHAAALVVLTGVLAGCGSEDLTPKNLSSGVVIKQADMRSSHVVLSARISLRRVESCLPRVPVASPGPSGTIRR